MFLKFVVLLNFYVNLNKEVFKLKFKINIIILTVLFLSSCSTVEKISDKINILKPKETPDVAGKLVCAAAGIESEDCVEAVKTDEEVDEMIRMVDAMQFTDEHGEVCAAGWQKGDEGMKATTEGVAEYLGKHEADL